MKIENYGTGARCEYVMRELMGMDSRGEIPPRLLRIILLPIPSSRDRVHVTGTERLIDELLADAGEGDLLIGYGIPAEAAHAAAERGSLVYDAMYDEQFQRENAFISAVGALGYILTELGRVPSDMHVGVVGYGRIGAHLTRFLLFLGARVRVYTSSDSTLAELGACGVECVYMSRDAHAIPSIDGLDLIVNTAPTDLSSTFPDGAVPRSLRLIELASGKNFDGVCGVEPLPSIPDRFYPDSAGRSYFRAIGKYIFDISAREQAR